MTSSRCSEATVLALLAVLVLAAVATPVAAVEVTDKSIPDKAEVGSSVEATVTLGTLYKNPQFKRWTLVGSTELNNVTWLVELKNPQGQVIATRQYNSSTFNLSGISTESKYGTVTKVSITVRGDVPRLDEYTWPKKETFRVMKLSQRAGAEGSNPIDTWTVHHYTTGTDANPGTREVRNALADARNAIQKARKEGASVSSANSTLQNAISAYESGNFQNAMDLAKKARKQAEQSLDAMNARERRNTLLLYGGGALLVLGLLGGGVWYYQNQQDDYDKLG